MPSTDPRYSNATDDIIQHMYANDDWYIEYLYQNVLGIFNISDDIFILFLEQVVHPMVRKKNCLDYVEMINKHIVNDGFKLQGAEQMSGYTVYKVLKELGGVKGSVKNLIFASGSYKPQIILSDSINNDIQIVKNEEYCLVYDQPIPTNGLFWNDLVNWWSEDKDTKIKPIDLERQLYSRLFNSLGSEPEKILFRTFFELFKKQMGEKLPALIPQVYLHYDPYTIKQLREDKHLFRQRMDFLMLFSNHIRIVIEVDGKQHYSEGEKSSPKNYAEMVREDRELKLNGYEVFRFGGYELTDSAGTKKMLNEFFNKLFKKYGCL